MFKFVVLSVLIAVAIARPHEEKKEVKKYTTFEGKSHAVIHQSREDHIKKEIVAGYEHAHETKKVVEKVVPRVVTKYVPVEKKVEEHHYEHKEESHEHHEHEEESHEHHEHEESHEHHDHKEESHHEHHEEHDHHHAVSHQERSEYISKPFVSEHAAPLIKKTVIKHPVEHHHEKHSSW